MKIRFGLKVVGGGGGWGGAKVPQPPGSIVPAFVLKHVYHRYVIGTESN